MAAFMQAWRNAFQKQLSTTVDVYGVTLARFIFALPLALIYISCLYHFQPITESVHFNLRFAIYVLIAALSQIAATALMVQLFKQKNYAIGVGLAKSEAVLAAIIAVVFLSDHLSLLGWFGVAVGGFAVFLMSKGRDFSDFSVQTLCIGIGSGLCFAITSLLVREASLELDKFTVYSPCSLGALNGDWDTVLFTFNVFGDISPCNIMGHVAAYWTYISCQLM